MSSIQQKQFRYAATHCHINAINTAKTIQICSNTLPHKCHQYSKKKKKTGMQQHTLPEKCYRYSQKTSDMQQHTTGEMPLIQQKYFRYAATHCQRNATGLLSSILIKTPCVSDSLLARMGYPSPSLFLFRSDRASG